MLNSVNAVVCWVIFVLVGATQVHVNEIITKTNRTKQNITQSTGKNVPPQFLELYKPALWSLALPFTFAVIETCLRVWRGRFWLSAAKGTMPGGN